MKHPRILEAEEAMDAFLFSPDGNQELLARALMLDALNRRDGILPKLEKRSHQVYPQGEHA